MCRANPHGGPLMVQLGFQPSAAMLADVSGRAAKRGGWGLWYWAWPAWSCGEAPGEQKPPHPTRLSCGPRDERSG